jgi:hypothetical protein
MKLLRYILFLLFVFLGFFSGNLKAEIIILETEKVEPLPKQDFKEASAEKEWLGLLYLEEKSFDQDESSFFLFSSRSLFRSFSRELCPKILLGNSQLSFQITTKSKSHRENGGWVSPVFYESEDLVDAWKVLDDAGVDDVLRKDPSWLNRVTGWTDDGLEIASEGRILREGTEVGRVVGDRLHVKYSGHGGDVVCTPDKTTTLLGKWKDPACGGTCELIDSKLSKSGQNTGGANVLSEEIPSGWTDQQIWDNVNEPWLRDASSRGDVIRVVSDPTVPANIYKPELTSWKRIEL